MGNCIYCGKPAGFFKKKHKECEAKYRNGEKSIIDTINNSFLKHETNDISETIEQICQDNFINNQNKKNIIIKGWENCVDIAFEDGLLLEEEESILVKFASIFSLTQNDLDKNRYYTKIRQGSILRQVMSGEMPNNLDISGNIPFNFQKSESLIWLQQNVKYLETKTKTQYVGGSQGVSIRVAKGLYYRTGSFKGESVKFDETKHVDTGMLAITNKNIYFGGSIKNFRIGFNKIVSFTPYSDGFGLQKDNATAKPQVFVTEDSWFLYNLISNISNLN